jgi:hypothetical protein
VSRDKTVIQGATDLMQQPELCNELFTQHFIKHMRFTGLNLLQKYVNLFFQDKPIHKQSAKFYFIKFEGKVYEL